MVGQVSVVPLSRVAYVSGRHLSMIIFKCFTTLNISFIAVIVIIIIIIIIIILVKRVVVIMMMIMMDDEYDDNYEKY